MTEQQGSRPDGDGGETVPAVPSRVDESADEVTAGRLAAVEARFGGRLDDAQRDQIRRAIERQMTLAARLRRTPLANADEPEIVFCPYRKSAHVDGEAQGD